MNQLIMAVHDVKAEHYRPFFVENKASGIRGFDQVANDSNSEIFKYPDDFRLVLLGEFNPQKGEIFLREPEQLGFASEFKRTVRDLKEVRNG